MGHQHDALDAFAIQDLRRPDGILAGVVTGGLDPVDRDLEDPLQVRRHERSGPVAGDQDGKPEEAPEPGRVGQALQGHGLEAVASVLACSAAPAGVEDDEGRQHVWIQALRLEGREPVQAADQPVAHGR